jgi:hypothetical protein
MAKPLRAQIKHKSEKYPDNIYYYSYRDVWPGKSLEDTDLLAEGIPIHSAFFPG